jgi:hypothetical protein
MSDSATEAAPQASADPQGSAQPTASAASAQPAAQAAAPVKVDMTPEQLKARLDEERQKGAAKAKQEAEATYLKALGVTNIDEAKAKIEAQKKLEEEKLSELQRRDKAIEELKPKAERASALESVVKRQADAELAKLTDPQRAAVQRLAGDDPVKVWDALEVLAPTWASVAPAAPPAATAPAAPKPLPAAATTMPAPRAPSPTNPQQVTESPLATWERLTAEQKPHLAAVYYLQNSAAIIAAQNARSA